MYKFKAIKSSTFLLLGTLFVPGGIPCLVQAIASWGLPSAVLYLGKAIFVYPLTYHYLNGIRHLVINTII